MSEPYEKNPVAEASPIKREKEANGKTNTLSTIFWLRQRSRNHPRFVLAAVYLFSMLIHFTISLFGDSNFIIATFSYIFGIIWTILLPGLAVTSFIFPSKKQSIWIVLLVGILLECCAIQTAFLLNLGFNMQILPQSFIYIYNSILVFSMLIRFNSIHFPDLGKLQIFLANHKNAAVIFLIGIILRLTLAYIGMDAIAPDACLYSDYGRNLLNGQYLTLVVNDNRIYNLWNGIQYCFHQSFTYLAALSFFIVDPWALGPSPILLLFGIILAGLGYQVSNQLFGEKAGIISASLIMILPIFIFHSVFSFGPEITSLTMILGGISILLQDGDKKSYILAGLFFALSDLIWYSNFLLFITALPFFLIFVKSYERPEMLFIILITALVGATRVFFVYLDVYTISLLSFIILISGVWILHGRREIKNYALFLFSIIILEIIWRGVIQIEAGRFLIFQDSQIMTALLQAQNPQLSIFLSEITPQLVFGFLMFYLTHLTPPLLFLALGSFMFSIEKRNALGCLMIILVGSVGTIFLFASLANTKDVLTLNYFYSDSRFLLSLVVIGIISASGAIVGNLTSDTNGHQKLILPNRLIDKKKLRRNLSVLILSFMIPSFMLIPLGVLNISYEVRYGWVGFPDVLTEVTNPDDLILCERATEMVWLTQRRAVYPLFSIQASLGSSLEKIEILIDRHSADYFLMDGYTAARWRILYEILYTPMAIGGSIPVDIHGLNPNTQHLMLSSIILRMQTERNIFGDYARLFELGSINYSRISEINLLDLGWSASNNGQITNQSGNAVLEIGALSNYTNTWRPNSFDLDLQSTSGFILIQVTEVSANITRIEFYDNNGYYLGTAASIDDNLYFFITGSVTIGDIRIAIEGIETGVVIIDSLYLWNQTGFE
jgi:hypothetical protein